MDNKLATNHNHWHMLQASPSLCLSTGPGSKDIISLPLIIMLRQSAVGYLPFVGTSMIPLLWAGDRICIRPYIQPPVIGDIVLFMANGSLFMHRVVAIDRVHQTLINRGDAMFSSDPPVAMNQILGYFDGLYDPFDKKVVPLPFCRRIWNKLIRRLVQLENKKFQPALVVVYNVGLVRRLLHQLKTYLRFIKQYLPSPN